MPGSPKPDETKSLLHPTRALHPLASILSLALLTAGMALARSWPGLLVAAVFFAVLALRAEGRSWPSEVPILGLALLVFLVHVAWSGQGYRTALGPAAVIAFRLLALLYLLRWAARTLLGSIARWLMGLRPPPRPRVLLLLMESARLTAGLLPLALREAEQHVTALRGRGIRPGRGLKGLSRYLLAWFLPFLGTMLRVGDAYADALTARGYVPGRARRSALRTRWGMAEWVVLVGSAGMTAWLVRVH